jgi:hypothetical protein
MTNGSDTATAIALDGAGNVVVTGISLGSGTSDDIVTIAYSNDGAALSTNRYTSGRNYSSQANAIATDRSGNILVGGLSEKATGGYVFTVIKYSGVAGRLLSLQSRSGAVVLSWVDPGFTLQAANGLEAAFTNVPGATSPFTNFTLAPQRFYRLRSN